MSPRVPSRAMTTPRDAFWRHFSMNASCSKSSMTSVRYERDWARVARMNEIAHEVMCREFGERPWFRDFLEAKFGPSAHTLAEHGTAAESDVLLQQQTLEWYASWFANSRIGIDDIDLDRLRLAMTVPLELVSTLVPGRARGPGVVQGERAAGMH